jgi:hypothetical protein
MTEKPQKAGWVARNRARRREKRERTGDSPEKQGEHKRGGGADGEGRPQPGRHRRLPQRRRLAQRAEERPARLLAAAAGLRAHAQCSIPCRACSSHSAPHAAHERADGLLAEARVRAARAGLRAVLAGLDARHEDARVGGGRARMSGEQLGFR